MTTFEAVSPGGLFVSIDDCAITKESLGNALLIIDPSATPITAGEMGSPNTKNGTPPMSPIAPNPPELADLPSRLQTMEIPAPPIDLVRLKLGEGRIRRSISTRRIEIYSAVGHFRGPSAQSDFTIHPRNGRGAPTSYRR